MHFGLLGPLEVTYGDRLLDLGRPKQRAVLATLLLHANRVVSLDRFADILWPGEVAARSPGSLPVYIANLRRLVEP
jgi:DNA-binding SARP family transcriptional activator